jgi:hypothetical protein
MEATFFSETSVDYQRITRNFIPEDKNLVPCSASFLQCFEMYKEASEKFNLILLDQRF